MIADDGVTPILMDFGSATKARIRVDTRSQALLQQVGQAIDSGAGLICHGYVSGHRSRAEHNGLQSA